MATAVRLPEGYLVRRRDEEHPDSHYIIAAESQIDVGMLVREDDEWHALCHFTDETTPAAHADPDGAMVDLIDMVEFTLIWCFVCGNEVDEEGQRQATRCWTTPGERAPMARTSAPARDLCRHPAGMGRVLCVAQHYREPTTEEDRGLFIPNADNIGAYCGSCHADGEPAGASSCWTD